MDWSNGRRTSSRGIPIGENVTRQEILADFPKGDEHRALQRDIKYALSNLERQMLVVKQFEDVSGRRRRLSLFHRVHGVYDTMDFESSLVDLIRRMGPVKGSTLRFYVSRSFEDLTIALMNLEKDQRIAKVMALVPDPEAFYCMPDEVELLQRPRREDRKCEYLRNLTRMFHVSFGKYAAFLTEVGIFRSSRA